LVFNKYNRLVVSRYKLGNKITSYTTTEDK
jgi:hypothetical protein